MQNSCFTPQEICGFLFRLLYHFVPYKLAIYSVTSFSGESGEAPDCWVEGMSEPTCEAELSPVLDQDGQSFLL